MENDQPPKTVTRAHLFARLEVTQLPAQAEQKPEDELPPTAAADSCEQGGKTE
ncbi:hypothetical protein WHX56_14065 [Achromobacter veterisilvae]|uniref:Uncharacterized protein n=1 Tax=Achromobacter veterisilvae TaxID=2069367 RepID=A0ABZ2S8U2_9BURK